MEKPDSPGQWEKVPDADSKYYDRCDNLAHVYDRVFSK